MPLAVELVVVMAGAVPGPACGELCASGARTFAVAPALTVTLRCQL